jgi:hypothetical protein
VQKKIHPTPHAVEKWVRGAFFEYFRGFEFFPFRQRRSSHRPATNASRWAVRCTTIYCCCLLKGADKMKVDPSEIEEALKLLEATPQRLEAFSKGIDQTQLHFSSAEEPWSRNDILAHLCTCADVWGKSIMAMISQEHPILRYVSPRTWMRKTHYPEQDFHASLAAFSKQRSELLGVLKTPKKQ